MAYRSAFSVPPRPPFPPAGKGAPEWTSAPDLTADCSAFMRRRLRCLTNCSTQRIESFNQAFTASKLQVRRGAIARLYSEDGHLLHAWTGLWACQSWPVMRRSSR
jgi:hypothetical protein